MAHDLSQPVNLKSLLQRGADVDFIRTIRKAIEFEQPRQTELIAAVERTIRQRYNVQSRELVTFDLALKHPHTMRPLGNTPGVQSVPTDLDADEVAREVKKRREVNQLIQGGAVLAACDYSGLNLPDGIQQAYFDLMAVGAYQQVQFQNIQIDYDHMPPAGTVQVSHETTPPLITARAISIPLLLHEASKGCLELAAMWGLPGACNDEETPSSLANYDQALRTEVLKRADNRQFEASDLTLGVDLWQEKFGHLRSSQIFEAFSDYCQQPAGDITSKPVNGLTP